MHTSASDCDCFYNVILKDKCSLSLPKNMPGIEKRATKPANTSKMVLETGQCIAEKMSPEEHHTFRKPHQMTSLLGAAAVTDALTARMVLMFSKLLAPALQAKQEFHQQLQSEIKPPEGQQVHLGVK